MRKIIPVLAVLIVAAKLFAAVHIGPYEVIGFVVSVPFLTAAIYGLLKAL